ADTRAMSLRRRLGCVSNRMVLTSPQLTCVACQTGLARVRSGLCQDRCFKPGQTHNWAARLPKPLLGGAVSPGLGFEPSGYDNSRMRTVARWRRLALGNRRRRLQDAVTGICVGI